MELKKILTDGNFLASSSWQLLVDKLTSVEETLLIRKVKFPSKDINLQEAFHDINNLHQKDEWSKSTQVFNSFKKTWKQTLQKYENS